MTPPAMTPTCEHEGPDGRRDCDARAVLCIHHGGHDACAVALMETQRNWPQPWASLEELAEAMCVERYQREGCREQYGAEVWQESKSVRDRWIASARVAMSRPMAKTLQEAEKEARRGR
jgi:hypothetical protein